MRLYIILYLSLQACLTADCASFVHAFPESASSTLRIAATPDNGWAVFNFDGFKLYKFDACGHLQWGLRYSVPATTWGGNDFLALAGGGFAFLTRVPGGSDNLALLVRLDVNGHVVWSRLYGDTQYDHFPYTLNQDASGNLFVFENNEHHTTSPSYMVISKIDVAGNVAWSRQYDPRYTWGGSIVTSDNGMLTRTGWYFVKTDASGNVQWTSCYIATGTYDYHAPVEVIDGYIFTTYDNNGGGINFHKIDKQGQLMWNQQYKHTSVAGAAPRLKRMSNGHFMAAFASECIEFDKDLVAVQTLSSDAALGLGTRDFCFLADGSMALAGVSPGGWFIARVEPASPPPCMPAASSPVISLRSYTPLTASTSSATTALPAQNFPLISTTLNLSSVNLCPSPVLSLGNDTSVCGATTLLLHSLDSYTYDHYLWSTGDTTESIGVNHPGTFTLRVSNDCGDDVQTDTIVVTMFPPANPYLGPARFICDDSSVVLNAPPCDSCDFAWSTGSISSSLEVVSGGMYWLSVVTQHGCSSTDTVQVSQGPCSCSLFLPSAFTPNGDGRNERFTPVYYCETSGYSLEVFDRWGRLLFSATDPAGGWNGFYGGSLVQPGLYPYRLVYTPVIKGQQGTPVVKTGTVTVIY